MNTNTENPLLTSVPSGVAERYFEALIGNSGHGVEVRLDAGGGRGKGVFATKHYDEGDVIFEERPLAAVQELDSKVDVSTCSHCFRAVGTVEEHVGGKICCLINELSEAADQDDLQAVQDRVDKIYAAVDSRFLEGLLSGSVKLPLTDKVDMAQPVPCRAGCGDEYCSLACEAQAWDSCHCLLCTVGQDDLAEAEASTTSRSDHKGKAKAAAAAPHKHQHNCSRSHGSSSSSSRAGNSKKPKAVVHHIHGATVNRTALADFFEHADDSNDIFRVAAHVIASTIVAADHLLRQQAADAAEHLEAAAAYEGAVIRATAGANEVDCLQTVTALQPQQQQLESEDVEVQRAYSLAVAAAVSARKSTRVLLPGDLPPSLQQQQQRHDANQQLTELQPSAGDDSSSSSSTSSQEQYLSALQAAFLPLALGHKIPWWNIPLCHHSSSTDAQQHSEHPPPSRQPAAASEVDHSHAPGCQNQQASSGSSNSDGCCSHDHASCAAHYDNDDAVDVVELSAQMRELAEESLKLLRRAIRYDRFPQLFDIQLYGSLVGMFELNNLALTVPAPVARYKHMLLHPDEAGVAAAEAAAALDEVRPLLEALGDEADAPAQGTGFYALQSCINHSCSPNAAAECLANGNMVIKALKAIPSGSEVLLSYIEEEDVGLYERRAMLRDYGFVCRCDRCTAEELAEQLGQQQLTKT